LLNNRIFFSKVQTAKLALRRLKTLRHPNILRYIDALEVRIKEMFKLIAVFCHPVTTTFTDKLSLHVNSTGT